MATKTWDPSQVVVTIGGLLVSGYAPDAFVECTYNDNAFHTVAGCEGEVTRTLNLNRSGTIHLTLLQTSDSNNMLDGFSKKDRLGGRFNTGAGAGCFDIQVKDLTGGWLASGAKAWIEKPASFRASASGVGTVEWVIAVQQLDLGFATAPDQWTITGVEAAALQSALNFVSGL